MKYIGLDCSNLCWRGFHATGGLSFNGEGTGVINSFLSALYFHAKKFAIGSPVFAFDSPKSIRKNICPSYKDKVSNLSDIERVKHARERKEVYKQVNILKKTILPTMGFKNLFLQSGLEADDILAKLVRNNPHEFIIITSDEDLLQLTDDCSWYSPVRKEVVNDWAFQKEYKIPPSKWALVKQIAGCKGDNVVGVPGVGEITAIKWINGGLKEDSIAWMMIDGCQQEIKRNGRLVRLPHPRTQSMTIELDEFNPDGFLAICDIYGLDKLSNKVHKWELLFR